MTDRERLIELIVNADTYDSYECKLCTKEDTSCTLCNAGKLADHILADGWIRPPCMVGDTVYPLNADRRFRAIIEKIEINANGLLFYWVQYDVGVDCTECWDEDLFTIDDIGKTVFLDETEYLIALKECEK